MISYENDSNFPHLKATLNSINYHFIAYPLHNIFLPFCKILSSDLISPT